jgi:hypothetical protein
MLAGICLLVGAGLPVAAGGAEKYTLKENIAIGDQWRVDLAMRLAGHLQFKNGERTITLELSAAAQHQFPERVLQVRADGLPTQVARFYEQAKADITAQGVKSTRTLRPELRFQVAQRLKDETITYSPAGPLTREELELTGEHLDVLMLNGLLPTDSVALGETWKVPIPVGQALVGLDGVTSQDLRCKLDSVQGDEAKVSVTGSVNGISRGAEVKATIEGSYVFDLKTQRLTSLQWKQKEQRNQGPVSPITKSETTVTVRRTFGAQAETLANSVVADVPAEPDASHLLLTFRDVKTRGELLLDRSWHVVSQTDHQTVLRLLERGELVAQLNVIPWAKAKPGEHVSVAELRKHIEESPGFKVDQVLQASEVPDDEKRWIYRVSVVGQSDGIQVLQNYYAVAGPQGDQLILLFTTDVAQADRLGAHDLATVGTVQFPEARALAKP